MRDLSCDLTLRCPVCGQRADMCFEHGDDWKRRTPSRTKSYSERLRREGGMVASGKFSEAGRPVGETREPVLDALEKARRGLRASRDRRGERDAGIIRDLAVAGIQALDDLDWGSRAPDWRESEVVKQARAMLALIGDPLWPGPVESDWAEVLRGVLAERDFIGDWLQRALDEQA